MTSDEMNRAIEFILQHEAQVSIRLEKLAEYQTRDHGLLAEMAVQGQRVTALLEIQSRRLDRAEKEDRAAQKRHEESQARLEQFQRRHEQLMEELRTGVDRILAKLSEKP